MILGIESDLATFKPVSFRAGLNVLLSDKAPGSGEKHTRNSAGKSSLIELIHFVLGANVDKTVVNSKELKSQTFYGSFKFSDRIVRVGRCAATPSKIFIDKQDADALNLRGTKEKGTERFTVSNETWKEFLGHAYFGLPFPRQGTAFESSFTPTFRSMIAYFARRRGAFLKPEKQSEMQSTWDWQANLSYLLGLDWSIPHELERVRQREKQLGELKKAADTGVIGRVIGSAAELRAQMVLADDNAAKIRSELGAFRVLDAYGSRSDRAAAAHSEMLAIERDVVVLKQTLAHLQLALRDETPPPRSDIERLYKAVGVELPGLAVRRFQDVQAFHESVIANRRARLEGEIQDLKSQIAEQQGRSRRLDQERSEIMSFLQGRGAMDDFVALQRQLAGLEVEAASLRERHKAAEILEGSKVELELDRLELRRRLQEDHAGRSDRIDEAIRFIGSVIRDLYQDRTGAFVVTAGDNGPKFQINIQGDRGGGISQVEIFCMDLALFWLTGRSGRGPGFLIHDSHLFDGVDERQVALALVLGGQYADVLGGQYIVTMNSDIYDKLPFPDGFDPRKAVLTPRLSDADAGGGLFGFRFD
jgi:uncharacterized protein YydD (DUF2326 family)